MHEIKIRYVLRRISNDEIVTMIMTLNDIENTKLNDYFSKTFVVIARNQFTGFLDIYGREIYDGDIVKCYNNRKTVVKWDSEWHGFNLIFDARPVEVFPLEPNMVEKIGDIYNNPERIEGE